MKTIIDKHIGLINESLDWAQNYNNPGAKNEFSTFKSDRRELKKIKYALEENCSAAVYGESQVGKSYVVSSLLSSPDKLFMVKFGGKEYSFINDLNSSGGANTEIETTGIITRFTTKRGDEAMANFVKIKTLTIVDIILILADLYYKDTKRDNNNVLKGDEINQRLSEISIQLASQGTRQEWITEDDIANIGEYFKNTLQSFAQTVIQSEFFNTIEGSIRKIGPKEWVEVFSLLWNKNENMNNLFSIMIDSLQQLNFATEIYVPYESVLRENGTLLDVSWINRIFDSDSQDTLSEKTQETNVYDNTGEPLVRNYPKSKLSALIAELSLVISEETANESGRSFLSRMDLLDFPGIRRRENISEENIKKEMGTLFRRGKISYLFNKYSKAQLINTLLFCQHNKQNGQGEMADLLDDWIKENIGNDEMDRTTHIENTDGVSPFFIVGTKFNIELKYREAYLGKPKELNNQWIKRFGNLENEVLQVKTHRWFNNWMIKDGKATGFHNTFMLRDYYHSKDGGIFEGYDAKTNSPERREIKPANYPNFREDLKKSFLDNEFVQKHFENPERAWDKSATLNHDGSELIIEALNKLAPKIDHARQKKYQAHLLEMSDKFADTLKGYSPDEDPTQKIEKIKRDLGGLRIRLDNKFAQDQSVFGKMMQTLMVDPVEIRRKVHSIINNYSETTNEINSINLIRMTVGINPDDSLEIKKARMCKYYQMEWDVLEKELASEGISVKDILDKDVEVLSTRADVVADKIIKYWRDDFLNSVRENLNRLMPQSDRIVTVLTSLFTKLDMKRVIKQIADSYLERFDSAFAPIIIADSIALILNNFATSLGNEYINPIHLSYIERIANDYAFPVNPDNVVPKVEVGSVEEVIEALNNSVEYLRLQNMNDQQRATVRKLPLYDNYWRWNELLLRGMILSNDVPQGNPAANAAIRVIANKVKEITY